VLGCFRISFSVVFNKHLLTQDQGSVDKLRSAFSGHLMLRHYVTMQSSSEQERRKASSSPSPPQIFLTEEFTLCFGPQESSVLFFFLHLFLLSFVTFFYLSLSLLTSLLLSSLFVPLSLFLLSYNTCDELIPSKLKWPSLYSCMRFFTVRVCLSECYQSK